MVFSVFVNAELFHGGLMYMLKKAVNISSFEKAKEFVNLTSKYDNVTMRLSIDNYEIDAHSIVGVLSIVDSNNDVLFTANVSDSDSESLLKDIQPFLAARVAPVGNGSQPQAVRAHSLH